MPSMFNEADVARRATRLLERFFTHHPSLQGTSLDKAFIGYKKDPRGLINAAVPATQFASDCVSTLLAYGCTDGRQHSLGRLLEVIRDEFLGTHPEPDYVELPCLLGRLCLLLSRTEEQAYLERLLAEIQRKAALYAPLRGIADIQPADAAAALLAPWSDDEDIALLRHQPRSRGATSEAESKQYDDILAAFSEVKQAVLLGAPGAGKSTTLRKLAADLARRALADPQAPLPLLVNLGDWREDETLETFLTHSVPEIGRAVVALRQAQRIIFLLDGLNEVPTATRESKAEGVLALKRQLRADTPFVVSCRQADYVGDLDLGLDTLTLQPLSPQRIRAVLRHWLPDDTKGIESGSAERLFWQLVGDEGLAEVLRTWLDAGFAEDAFWSGSYTWANPKLLGRINAEQFQLWQHHISNPRSLLRLASNPFMLTMLFQIWVFEKGVLPQNRGDLIARFVDRLLSREGLLLKDSITGAWRRTPDGERVFLGLTELAWIMQEKQGARSASDKHDLGVLTVVPREIALMQLGTGTLLKKAEDATLLEGEDEFRFRHQLLQEYFAARALQARIKRGPPIRASELWRPQRWWVRSGWEEAAVLLAGLYAEDCTPVIRWLKDAQPEVAAQCILESGAEIANYVALRRELHDTWLPRLNDLDDEPEPEGRAAIGRALGRLNLDDRKGLRLDVNGLPDIDWVDIPGAELIYQARGHRRIDSFRIARYPVTNLQYQAFLDATDGYINDRWWENLDNPNRDPVEPHWTTPNHPREMVSWFEAMAFCAWLGDELGLEIRLPTEWEWERAARGTDGRVYPWGKDYRVGHANLNEATIRAGPHNLARTSAVGIYPQGASSEGVLDLSGNVWEWCLNGFGEPEHAQRTGSMSRVLRGGSWGSNRDPARAVTRSGYDPSHRDASVGFRVVCALPVR